MPERNDATEDDIVESLQYNDFPLIGGGSNFNASAANSLLRLGTNISNEEEVSFSGMHQNYCVCYVDMINSTKIIAKLDATKSALYYASFLNPVSKIATNFDAKVFKTAGDSVICYFPKTSDVSNLTAFKNVIECGFTMIAAHSPINAILAAERLPSLNYRISVDYGRVELAKSKTSQSDDLFGSIMNLCAKINSKAAPNNMVIGNGLYQIVKALDDDYIFEEIGEYPTGMQDGEKENFYKLYSVKSRKVTTILDPFSRRSFPS